jgi:alkylation response protein AidB-like acyl-CoA dehydrogenase
MPRFTLSELHSVNETTVGSALGPAERGLRTFGCLDTVSATASLREVWSLLGADGVLTNLYHRVGGELQLRPAHLRALLSALDARGRTGITLATCVQVASTVPLLDVGSDSSSVAAEVLGGMLAGRATVALAATDSAAAGSDLSGLGTEIERLGVGTVVVTGGKRWITNATDCDHFLTLIRHRAGRHFTNFGWVLIPADAPGVSVEAADTPLFTGSGIGHVRFDRVTLPAEHLVGRPGRGLALFARHMTRERFAGALWAVAFMRRALDDTRQLLKRRKHDGESLWSLSTLRYRFAGALIEVRLLNALTHELQQRILGGYDAPAAALVKTAAARAAETVLGVCTSLQGADGYLPGAAQQLRAEAAIFGIGGGSVDLMLDNIAEHAGPLLAEVCA